MIFNIHAGHNPDGKIACGAIGLIKESTEARKVKNEVIRLLRVAGHVVYDCTVENGTSQSNVLTNIVSKCNAHKVDLDVSIHFNSGCKDAKGDNVTGGVEVLVYKKDSAAIGKAESVAKSISELGYRMRKDATSPRNGVKVRSDLYYLKKTDYPAMLIECCFVDDKDDVQIYDYQSMAKAIVKGIIGNVVDETTDKNDDEEAKAFGSETTTGDGKVLYRVQVGAYSVKANADALMKKLKDAGFDAFITKA